MVLAQDLACFMSSVILCHLQEVVKNPYANVGDVGLIPESGLFSRGGNGNQLQYSCLKNSMDRGAWQVAVHRVSKELDMTEHTL